MKLTTLVAFVGLLALATPHLADARVRGSKHDLSGRGAAGGTSEGMDEICYFCHTPHIANPVAPAWSQAQSTIIYTPYWSPTLEARVGQPTGTSKICLSCHDGQTAVDSYGGASGTATITGALALGTDLTQDHPISILYNAGGAEFNTRPTAGWAGTAADSLPLYGSAKDQVECGSCHNPHDYTGAGATKFLRRSEAAICTICHAK